MSCLERRAHATAWLAPLPPDPVAKDSDFKVSPASGTRDVRVIRSLLIEPTTVIRGFVILEITSSSEITNQLPLFNLIMTIVGDSDPDRKPWQRFEEQ